jgi:hypothetical protein
MQPFDRSEYLRLARDLAGRPDDDAALRSAISRADYAAYGRAAAYLVARGEFADRAVTHLGVWAVFKDLPEPARREIWTLGLRLKDQRVKADYQPSFRGSLTKAANEAIDRAAVVLALLALLERL